MLVLSHDGSLKAVKTVANIELAVVKLLSYVFRKWQSSYNVVSSIFQPYITHWLASVKWIKLY